MCKEGSEPAAGLYSRLGLRQGASEKEVRAAYYKLAKAYHPDRRKGDQRAEETFKNLARAAAILRNPKTKTLYDLGMIDDEGRKIGFVRNNWAAGYHAAACFFAFAVFIGCFAYLQFSSKHRIALAERDGDGSKANVSIVRRIKTHYAQFPAKDPPHQESALGESKGQAETASPRLLQERVYSPPNEDHPATVPPPRPASAPELALKSASQKSTRALTKPFLPRPSSVNSSQPASTFMMPASAKLEEGHGKHAGCAISSAARTLLGSILSQ